MKRLLIMRHAKSDWASGSTEDFDRPLNARGQKDVPILARFLAGSAPPDLVLASAARRAQETATRLLEGLNPTPELILDGRLYLSTPDTLATVLAGTAGDAGSVVVGPGENSCPIATALNASGDLWGIEETVGGRIPIAQSITCSQD